MDFKQVVSLQGVLGSIGKQFSLASVRNSEYASIFVDLEAEETLPLIDSAGYPGNYNAYMARFLVDISGITLHDGDVISLTALGQIFETYSGEDDWTITLTGSVWTLGEIIDSLSAAHQTSALMGFITEWYSRDDFSFDRLSAYVNSSFSFKSAQLNSVLASVTAHWQSSSPTSSIIAMLKDFSTGMSAGVIDPVTGTIDFDQTDYSVTSIWLAIGTNIGDTLSYALDVLSMVTFMVNQVAGAILMVVKTVWNFISSTLNVDEVNFNSSVDAHYAYSRPILQHTVQTDPALPIVQLLLSNGPLFFEFPWFVMKTWLSSDTPDLNGDYGVSYEINISTIGSLASFSFISYLWEAGPDEYREDDAVAAVPQVTDLDLASPLHFVVEVWWDGPDDGKVLVDVKSSFTDLGIGWVSSPNAIDSNRRFGQLPFTFYAYSETSGNQINAAIFSSNAMIFLILPFIMDVLIDPDNALDQYFILGGGTPPAKISTLTLDPYELSITAAQWATALSDPEASNTRVRLLRVFYAQVSYLHVMYLTAAAGLTDVLTITNWGRAYDLANAVFPAVQYGKFWYDLGPLHSVGNVRGITTPVQYRRAMTFAVSPANSADYRAAAALILAFALAVVAVVAIVLVKRAINRARINKAITLEQRKGSAAAAYALSGSRADRASLITAQAKQNRYFLRTGYLEGQNWGSNSSSQSLVTDPMLSELKTLIVGDVEL